jgi:DNA-binding response OmpR family regulator
MNTSDAIRVIIVEDDEFQRTTLDQFLRQSGFAVTGVPDGLSFYRALAEGSFDIAVIDLGLPDQSGETLVEYLRHNTEIPIIVLTVRDTLDSRVDCYEAGTDVFLSKPVAMPELAAAITSLVDRQRRKDKPAAAPQTTWVMLTAQRAVLSPDGKRVEFTGREWQAISTIATNAGRTTTKTELVEALYQRDDEGAEHALAMLIGRTRQKMEDALGSPSPILTEYGVGYRFGGRVVVRAE